MISKLYRWWPLTSHILTAGIFTAPLFCSIRLCGSTLEQVYGFRQYSAGPSEPIGDIVQGPDGAFYGTSLHGGSAGLGAVYRITTNGVATTLASFTGPNGSAPQGGLILSGDRAI